MTFALISPRDFAVGTEVAMIVAGVWFAIFARKAIRDILAAGEWPTDEFDRPGRFRPRRARPSA